MSRHRPYVFVVILGLSFLAGQSAAAPTIPLPEPGSEPGLLPALVILGLFATVAAAELVRPLRTRSGATSRRWVGNLSLCILSNGVVVLPTMTAFAAAFVSQLGEGGLIEAFGLPSTMRFVVAIIGLDALAYAQHRLLHRVDVLWRFHAVHHSDPEVDATTTFRHHPVEAIFNGALIGSVVLVIGFSPAEIAAYTWVSFTVELVAHANLALPSWFGAILGRLIVTPEFHHLHHSRAKTEANANFGQAFSIWDTLFGTAQGRSPEDSSRLEFGLEEFRGQKFHLPHYLLAQPLLQRTTEPAVTAASGS
ncbi:MAG TPA: sterol desaturase family protein [Stellaceae bacterium]|nr:sterol desaturase family protein [Stellaceae bacterium]